MKTQNPTAHGGQIRAGKRKTARPLATNRFLHVVMRSSRARGALNFLRPGNKRRIDEALALTAKEWKIETRQFRNVGNHFHLLLRGKTRSSIQNFLRSFSSRVALLITEARRGKPSGRFFDLSVFTRIVEWGTDYANLILYLVKNAFEQMGYSGAEGRRMVYDLKTMPANRMMYLEAMYYRE